MRSRSSSDRGRPPGRRRPGPAHRPGRPRIRFCCPASWRTGRSRRGRSARRCRRRTARPLSGREDADRVQIAPAWCPRRPSSSRMPPLGRNRLAELSPVTMPMAVEREGAVGGLNAGHLAIGSEKEDHLLIHRDVAGEVPGALQYGEGVAQQLNGLGGPWRWGQGSDSGRSGAGRRRSACWRCCRR